jgi:Domain of unknown function (DUF4124)
MSSPKRQRIHAGALCCCIPLIGFALTGFPLVTAATEPGATTVYRSVGPDGVVTFSDAPHPSAVPVEVIPPVPAGAEEQQRAAEMFEQQLQLLEILEASRHARADEEIAQQRLELDYVRTEAALERARLLQEQRDEDYSPRYSYPYWYAPQPFPPPAIGGPRPPHGERPSRPPSQRVMLP